MKECPDLRWCAWHNGSQPECAWCHGTESTPMGVKMGDGRIDMVCGICREEQGLIPDA